MRWEWLSGWTEAFLFSPQIYMGFLQVLGFQPQSKNMHIKLFKFPQGVCFCLYVSCDGLVAWPICVNMYVTTAIYYLSLISPFDFFPECLFFLCPYKISSIHSWHGHKRRFSTVSPVSRYSSAPVRELASWGKAQTTDSTLDTLHISRVTLESKIKNPQRAATGAF